MLHTLLFIFGSISIGFIFHWLVYWHQMHASVPFNNWILSGTDLLIILVVVGFVLSFFKFFYF